MNPAVFSKIVVLIGSILRYIIWSSPVVLLVIWAIMFFVGDSWWLPNMLLFGPRWMLCLPLLLLIPFAILNNRQLLLPLSVSLLVVAGLIMRFNLPIAKLNTYTDPNKTIRVLTCNLDSTKNDAPDIIPLLKAYSVDIAAMQESFWSKFDLPAGWQMINEHGLVIVSRYPISKVKSIKIRQPKEQWSGTFLLHATIHTPDRDLALCTIHLPTPRPGLMRILDKYTVFRPSRSELFYQEVAKRRSVAMELRSYVDGLKMPVIVAGDFNAPVDSPLYRSVWGDFSNAFSEVGFGYGWTQRAIISGFSYSARIDHILTGKGLVPRLSEIGPDIGSGHLPLIADITWE